MTLAPNIHAHAVLHQGRKQTVVRLVRPGTDAPEFWVCEDEHGGTLNVHRSNLMPIENIPNRFRRHSFDRYAHIIGAALAAWPNGVKVDPAPLRVDSFVQPLRDAITAKQRYKYVHPSINDREFDLHAASLVVRSGDGFVFVGSLDGTRVSKERKLVGTVITTAIGTEITVTPHHLETVCQLLHNDAFDPLPTFIVRGAHPTVVADMEARYNVTFVVDENDASKYYLLGPMKVGVQSV